MDRTDIWSLHDCCMSSGGIGYATIQHLVRHGAKVYMAARDKVKADDAIRRLQDEGLAPGNGQVSWLSLDLGNPALARAAAKELLAKEDRLHILSGSACPAHLLLATNGHIACSQ